MESFKDAHSGLQSTINTSFEKHRQDLYELNCKRLLIFVVLCGKQNIPFHGHHGANVSKSLSKGNFKVILEFRALIAKALD